MFTEYDKEEIMRLRDGCSHEVDLGEESGAEIWLKNGYYFLFAWPQFGGFLRFERAYRERDIMEMITEIKSWT